MQFDRCNETSKKNCFFALALPIRPLWREVIKFHYLFCHRVYNLQTRMDKERVKLYLDRGTSSLRNNNRFHLYSRQIAYSIDTGKTLVQRFRRMSESTSVSQNSYSFDENLYEQGECSRNEDLENNLAGINRAFRKISISKRKRRGKNSVSDFTQLHDLEEEKDQGFEIDGYDARKRSSASMGLQSIASLDEERVNELDEDLAVLEQKGYYMESDIEEEDEEEDKDGQSSHGSNADFEDSSSSEEN